MTTAHDLLEQGIAALKAGRRAEARNLLVQVVQQNQHNETAWLWLSGAVDSDDERRTCLENVLTINPNNSMAKRGLESLKAKQGIRQLSPTPSPAGRPIPTAQPHEQPTRPPAGAGTSDVTQRERPKVAPKRKKAIPKQTTLMVGIGAAIVAVVCIAIVGIWWVSNSGLLQLGSTSSVTTDTTQVPSVAQATPTPTPTLTPTCIPTWTPTPTKTPAPTRTPRPKNTPRPTSTPRPTIPPQQGTFHNPVPIGRGYRFPGYGTMTVEESRWRPGQTGLAIVYLSFACERPADQACDTGDFLLDAVGKSGSGYKREFESAIPEPDFGSFVNPDVYGGATEKGYVGFLITQHETSLMMKAVIMYQNEEVFFNISE